MTPAIATLSRKEEHLFRLPDGRVLYVTVHACDDSAEPYGAFVGDGRVLNAVYVEDHGDEPGFGWFITVDGQDLVVSRGRDYMKTTSSSSTLSGSRFRPAS